METGNFLINLFMTNSKLVFVKLNDFQQKQATSGTSVFYKIQNLCCDITLLIIVKNLRS